ncbi:MAG: polysaccharide deacetylase family protein [Cyclobacteriaceae bacterium]
MMKKLSLNLLALCLVFYACAQKDSSVRLVVRGDDMGYSHSGNLAIIQCYQEGIQQSIEVIVPSPWFPEAVRLLEENPGVDVGIHLALTSEWDNVKWRPLTECPGITDPDGYFYPMIRPHKKYPGQSILENDWKIEEIEQEFRAQIELALKKIPRITHITGHMGCTGFDNKVKVLAEQLAKEYNLYIDLDRLGVSRATYAGPKGTSEEKIESFIKMLRELKPGTYIMVDHPGLNNAELQAISHIGYETVAIDRQGVTDTWTSEKVKAAIKELGIEIISYADLKRKSDALK